MSNLSLKCSFYELSKPSIDEKVLARFYNMDESHFNGKLEEYDKSIFLKLSDATKKRSVVSWKNIVPLNKPIIVKVENNDSDIIQVSLCYLNEDIDNKKNMEQFTKNNILISFFKKLSVIEKKDINELWKAIIYPIDKYRREEYESNDIPCLLDYCNDKRDIVESIFKNSEYYDIYTKFIELLDNLSNKKSYRIITKFDIISNGGVKNTIDLFKKAIDTINFEYYLRYDSASSFIFESNSIESSDDDHQKLCKFLKTEGDNLNPKTFVRYVSTVHI